MPNVKVIFQRIDVHQDGEPLQKGKLYWRFAVNGSKVSERMSSNPLLVTNGDQVDLNVSKSIERDANEDIIVSGFVAEKDGFTSGKDENAPFTRTFDRSENWGDGEHDVRLRDRKLDVTLVYTIQAE